MTEQTQMHIDKLPKVLMKKVTVVRNPELLKNIKNSLYQEDLLYESKPGDFLKLNRSVTLLNKLNLITNSSLTVARYEKGAFAEKTSENLARLIGQSNYDTLFSALCSVFSQELKIRGILSVLTEPRKITTTSVQTENQTPVKNNVEDKACQTEETSIGLFMKEKPKKSRLKRLTPYVVTDNSKQKHNIKKIVINPNNFHCFTTNDTENSKHNQKTVIDPDNCQNISTKSAESNKDMESPVSMQDDNSRESLALSVNTWEPLVHDPMGLIEKIQNVTQPPQKQQVDWGTGTQLQLLDGTVVKVPFKIEDQFHIVTPETIKYIPSEVRTKVLWYQAHIDWKFCLTRDEKNDLPIHVAAMNGDVGMLRRQCVVLKARQESVDILAAETMTALQIAIYTDHPQCTSMLLHFGADPLTCDDEYRNCFHMAAENSPEHLKALIHHCETNPLKVLQDNEELWTEELATKPKEYLSRYLLRKILTMFDNQGYTPLMRASIEGKYENVKTLLEAAPDTINAQMPNCGNTALYVAVSAACQDCNNRGNKSVVADNFRKTIELLVEYGADPALENHSGVNVNTLLTDFKVGELSMIVANKMTRINCFENNPSGSSRLENVVFMKSPNGTISVADLNKVKIRPKEEDTKPLILDNVKIEYSVPPPKASLLKPVKKEIVDVTTQAKPTANMFVNSFKDFVESRLYEKSEPKHLKDTSKVAEFTSTVRPVNAITSKVILQNLGETSKVTNLQNLGETSKLINLEDTSKLTNLQNIGESSKLTNLQNVEDTSKLTSVIAVNSNQLTSVIAAPLPHTLNAVVKRATASKVLQCPSEITLLKIGNNISIKTEKPVDVSTARPIIRKKKPSILKNANNIPTNAEKPVNVSIEHPIIRRKRASTATMSVVDLSTIEQRTLKKTKLFPN